MRSFLKTAFILIVLFLILIHYTGFSNDVKSLTSGSVELVKTFQGGYSGAPGEH